MHIRSCTWRMARHWKKGFCTNALLRKRRGLRRRPSRLLEELTWHLIQLSQLAASRKEARHRIGWEKRTSSVHQSHPAKGDKDPARRISVSFYMQFRKSLVDRIHSQEEFKWNLEFKEDASNYLGEPTLLRFQNRLMNKKNLLPPLQYITKKLVASSNRHSPAGNHMLSRSSFINLWTERPKKFRNCTRASQKPDLSTYSLKQTGTTVGIGLFPHLYDWLLQGFAPF